MNNLADLNWLNDEVINFYIFYPKGTEDQKISQQFTNVLNV